MRSCEVLEEGLPRLREQNLESAARSYKAATGMGCAGFHPKVPQDWPKETRGEVVGFLENVEQCGRWPPQACTKMFFLIPKNVTSERPIALVPTMIGWWEALRAPEVAKQHETFRIEWDATDGRNGGAERTLWETFLEMERFSYYGWEENQGATALVLD